ncbi:MAG: UDP-3-O-(3-hydroxymyristoyl)glucosamine N-acyltransferase [Phycisphaerales bacterium]|nr:UDP-3-O-(3-hydroxymyristoyl)glucosamine N-acyltransferase [Phycisphaerales bacterium]
MSSPARAGIGVGSTVAEIAAFVGGDVEGHGDLVITGLNSLEAAAPDELTFIRSSRWAADWATVSAGATLVTRGVEIAGHDPSSRAVVHVDDAEIAMIKLLEAFDDSQRVTPEPGIDASAVIDPAADIGTDVFIGPHVSVAAGATVEDGACLHAGVRIGTGAVIGAGSVLHPNVVVGRDCRIGRGCCFHGGVVIGADGFGYRPDPGGGGLLKVPHLGIVEIGDDVEIGAGTCVDRGKFGATSIGTNTKIDNLVQVAHNVTIGCSTVIAAQVGIAGSASIGHGVQVGAHAGIVEHIRIGDGARIGAKAGVIRDVPAGEAVAGIPAQPAKDTLRQLTALRKLPEYLARQGRNRR